jgi:Ni/Co efflux regulator RcnB
MSVNIKSAIAGTLAALMLAAVPQAQADGGHGRWKHHLKHNHHDRYEHWGHRHDRVVVIREPRYVNRQRAYVVEEPYLYRERAYVVEEPYYYPARRPSLVLGVNVPPLVIGF